jgi:hypothetical protein
MAALGVLLVACTAASMALPSDPEPSHPTDRDASTRVVTHDCAHRYPIPDSTPSPTERQVRCVFVRPQAPRSQDILGARGRQ